MRGQTTLVSQWENIFQQRESPKHFKSIIAPANQLGFQLPKLRFCFYSTLFIICSTHGPDILLLHLPVRGLQGGYTTGFCQACRITPENLYYHAVHYAQSCSAPEISPVSSSAVLLSATSPHWQRSMCSCGITQDTQESEWLFGLALSEDDRWEL